MENGLHLNDGGVRKYSANLSKFARHCYEEIRSIKTNINSSTYNSRKKNGLNKHPKI